MANNVIQMKGVRELPAGTPKTVRSTMDTVLLTPEGVNGWKLPPFQRPLRVNNKVQALAEELKQNDGVIPGILTIGVLDKQKFLIDGQHRVEAFKISGLAEGYADIRLCHFDTMGAMGQEFVNLNSSLVRLKPDDILRGLESSHAGLSYIRKKCPYVGYDYIRRGTNSPILSMNLLLRAWFSAASDVPQSGGYGVQTSALSLTDDEAHALVEFVEVVFSAWGRDPEYARLWASLNLTLCAWLWRRTVIVQYSANTARLTKNQFGKCMMGLSANAHYSEWLAGRMLSDRDRSPAYDRIKTSVALRMKEMSEFTGKHIRLPAPAWAHSGGSRKEKLAQLGLS